MHLYQCQCQEKIHSQEGPLALGLFLYKVKYIHHERTQTQYYLTIEFLFDARIDKWSNLIIGLQPIYLKLAAYGHL